jgi:hypothetical protein
MGGAVKGIPLMVTVATRTIPIEVSAERTDVQTVYEVYFV